MNDQASPSKLFFASDYMEGAHPMILQRLMETNLVHSAGYGTDEYSESARALIRTACNAPDAEIYFLVGGTQANATVIKSALRPYQGVIAAETGHVSVHEAGAIEAGGHKVITLPHRNGKLQADSIERCIHGFWDDANHEHMVMPGMVYISQPTEFGTLYSLEELTKISTVCHRHNVSLYVDGARLAYALACPQNDVTLPDLARLCDAFYIGGTKCGALFGEALVVPEPQLLPHFFTLIKQSGALLAKGWLTGLQFRTLFTDGLYERLGARSVRLADRLRDACLEKGIPLRFGSPTNQVFLSLDAQTLARLGECVEYSFWEMEDAEHTVIRLAASWATREEDLEALIRLL